MGDLWLQNQLVHLCRKKAMFAHLKNIRRAKFCSVDYFLFLCISIFKIDEYKQWSHSSIG